MWAKQHTLWLSGLCVFLISVFLGGFKGAGLFALIATALIAGIWAHTHLQRWLVLLAFCIPLSIDLPVLFGIKLSVVGECLALVLAIWLLIKYGWQSLLPQKHSWLWLLIFADVVISIVSAIFSDLPLVALKRVMLKLVYVYVFYVGTLTVLRTPRDWRAVFSAYALGLVIPAVYALAEHSVRGFSQASSVKLGQPFFADHTIYAAAIAFVIPLVFTQLGNKFLNALQRLGWGSLLLLLAIALLFSYSRAAWISVLVAGCLAGLLWWRTPKWLIGTIVLAAGVFVYANFGTWYSQMKTTQIKYNDDAQAHLSSVTNLKSDASNLERINRWYCAIEMGKAKPILGFGPGTYQFSYDAFQRPDLMTRISTHHGDRGNAHSEYLGAFAETGVLGLLILVALAIWSVTCIIDLNRSQRKSPWQGLLLGVGLGLVTFWVHGFFNSFMDTDKISFLVYGSLAFLTQVKQYTSRGEADTNPTIF